MRFILYTPNPKLPTPFTSALRRAGHRVSVRGRVYPRRRPRGMIFWAMPSLDVFDGLEELERQLWLRHMVLLGVDRVDLHQEGILEQRWPAGAIDHEQMARFLADGVLQFWGALDMVAILPPENNVEVLSHGQTENFSRLESGDGLAGFLTYCRTTVREWGPHVMSPELIALRDKAIEDYRNGDVEPLLPLPKRGE